MTPRDLRTRRLRLDLGGQRPVQLQFCASIAGGQWSRCGRRSVWRAGERRGTGGVCQPTGPSSVRPSPGSVPSVFASNSNLSRGYSARALDARGAVGYWAGLHADRIALERGSAAGCPFQCSRSNVSFYREPHPEESGRMATSKSPSGRVRPVAADPNSTARRSGASCGSAAAAGRTSVSRSRVGETRRM
jgi:hypothetical protein